MKCTSCMPLSIFWSRAADKPLLKLALVRRIIGLLGSKNAMVFSLHTLSCIFLNAFSSSFPHWNLVSLLISRYSGAAIKWHSSQWSCPGIVPFSGNCRLLPYPLVLYTLEWLSVCRVMASTHLWWGCIQRTLFDLAWTGISLCWMWLVEVQSSWCSVSSLAPRSMSSLWFRQWGMSPKILNIALSKTSCDDFAPNTLCGL